MSPASAPAPTDAPLTPEAVRDALAHWSYGATPPHIGAEIECVGETGSTNDDLLAAGAAGAPSGRVRFAETQSRGRGRRGDAWVSPPGANLLFSILLRPEAPLPHWTRLPLLAGVALCRALERLLPPETAEAAQLRLKWPNDLHARGRKLAGLLVESRLGSRDGFVVLGIGLNVNLPATAWPAPLCDEVISLRDLTGRTVPRADLAGAVLAELDRWHPAGLSDEVFQAVLRDFRQRCALTGHRIAAQLRDRPLRGVVRGIGAEGELLLDLDTGERRSLFSADRVRLE